MAQGPRILVGLRQRQEVPPWRFQGSRTRLCGSHSQHDAGGASLLRQDGDDVCTHLMALLETEGGNPGEALRMPGHALRMPGHGEHSLGKRELL